LLENKIKANGIKIKVINCGIGGNTISDAAKRLEDDVLFFKPAFVVINFGFNDARLFKIKRNNNIKNKSNSLYLFDKNYYTPKTGKEEFRNVLENIIEKLQGNHINVILTGLYKVNKIKTGIFYNSKKQLVDLQNKVYKEYDSCLNEVSIKKDTAFLDLWNKLNNYEKIKSYFQKDGFHLGDSGYKLIADNLSDIIVKNCFLK
jgi:lysophospholipase L1-like esterase